MAVLHNEVWSIYSTELSCMICWDCSMNWTNWTICGQWCASRTVGCYTTTEPKLRRSTCLRHITECFPRIQPATVVVVLPADGSVATRSRRTEQLPGLPTNRASICSEPWTLRLRLLCTDTHRWTAVRNKANTQMCVPKGKNARPHSDRFLSAAHLK